MRRNEGPKEARQRAGGGRVALDTPWIDAMSLLGGFLKTAEKHPPGPDKRIGATEEPIPLPPTLAELGLTKKESSESQLLDTIAETAPVALAAMSRDLPRISLGTLGANPCGLSATRVSPPARMARSSLCPIGPKLLPAPPPPPALPAPPCSGTLGPEQRSLYRCVWRVPWYRERLVLHPGQGYHP